MPFNLVDLIVAVPLAAMFIKGMKNGFAHEIISLVGQIAAIFLAFTYMEQLGQAISNYFSWHGPGVPLVAFLIIYLIFVLLVQLIIKVVNSIIKVAFLSTFNMLAGAAFSTFKGTLVFSVIFVLLAGFNLPDQQTRDDSFLYSIVLPVAPATYNAIAVVYPGVDDFADQAGQFLEKFKPFTESEE
ncbi:MAG: membrane protein required for colicin V production [Bacteroidetes bacterium HLUCCA01]|nr:MAG: membrane protein required for colicin V production [Bacteroidetes bacterium HLUCCA01]